MPESTRPDASLLRRAELPFDRLPEPGPSLEVTFVRGADFGADSERGARTPHRHDYHELIWVRSGSGQHLIDGEVSIVEPHTVTLIGRGQVHVFQRARAVHGAVVRFGEELLHGDAVARANPAWLLGARGVHRVTVPAGDRGRLEAVISALGAESHRPPDARSLDLERHLLSVLLLWVERWYGDARTEPHAAGDREMELYRRFVEVLERDFARHGDAAHYAAALRVPPAVLSRSLSELTGRATKELITQRRMLEAARLLRFSDLAVGEIAFRSGFADPLYFSRAFKRHYGEAPIAYRERMRGRAD